MLMDRKITFDDYRGIIRALRDPEKGCPWDKAQTHESLKPCMIHEMTEAVAAVNLLTDTGDADNLSEELGDVLLQVDLHAFADMILFHHELSRFIDQVILVRRKFAGIRGDDDAVL